MKEWEFRHAELRKHLLVRASHVLLSDLRQLTKSYMPGKQRRLGSWDYWETG